MHWTRLPTAIFIIWIIGFILISHIGAAIPTSVIGIPFAAFNTTTSQTLRNSYRLFSDNEYTYDLYWAVENNGASSEQLHVAMILTATTNKIMNFSWTGLGIGCQTMLDCKSMVVIHQLNSTPYVSNLNFHEHTSLAAYEPPGRSTNQIIVPVSGGYENDLPTFQRSYADFVTPTKPNDSYHDLIDVNGPFNMIFAFNPSSDVNYRGERFTYHGPDYRGAVKFSRLIASPGSFITISAKTIATLDQKVAHGVGMMLVWLVVFPTGVFWARYLRTYAPWQWIHISLQTFGYFMVLVLFVVIITAIQLWSRPHAILGVCLILLATVQIALGALNFAGMRNERIGEYRHYIRRFHHIVGPTIILGSLVQVYLGLSTVFPYIEPRGHEYWILYFVLIGVNVLVFITAEFFYRNNFNRDPLYRKTSHRKKSISTAKSWFAAATGGASAQRDSKGVNNNNLVGPGPFVTNALQSGAAQKKVDDGIRDVALANTTGAALIALNSTRNSHSQEPEYDIEMVEAPILRKRSIPKEELRQFTWQSLDEEVSSDLGLYVVAAGKYVYDISTWIHSHPGGKVILKNVAGTDISNDYFHEAGFDVEDVNPNIVPVQRSRGNPNTSPAQISAPPSPIISPLQKFTEMESIRGLQTQLNEDDWKLLVKARRTHVHTKLAVQKLTQFLVGELIYRPGKRPFMTATDSRVTPSNVKFDPYEYRRYAITQITTVNKSASAPVIKFRFVRLYPHDVRAEEPMEFHPGECVEIQACIGSQYVSRYITPIGGTPIAFEAYIKIYSSGTMTRWLSKQRTGDKQVKIRGPFGTPFVINSLSTPTQYPDLMIFFSAGSGFAPALQAMKQYLLPANQTLRVIVPYNAQQKDELTLEPRSLCSVLHHYMDGWAYGTNLTLKSTGVFPLSVTLPVSSHTRFIIVNSVHKSNETTSDLFGLDLLKAAYLAAPYAVQAMHCVSDASTVSVVPGLPDGINTIIPGRLNLTVLLDVLEVAGAAPHPLFGMVPESRKIYVCGPRSYTSALLDLLSETPVAMSEVQVLPPDMYV